MRTEAVSKLGIKHPIVQGPFGGGLSTTRMASIVSNMGGLGSYGAHILTPEEIVRLTREMRSLTSNPFALNLWISDHDEGGRDTSPPTFDRWFALFEPYYRELDVLKPEIPQFFHQPYEQQIEALLEARPPVFSFVFGIPSAKVLDACKQRGIVTLGAATSIAEARALDAAGVDLILATGFEAGGHRPSFLARAEDSLMGTFALTQLVAPRVKAPVLAAGGIADEKGMRAAITLGAQAVQIGTAFLATEESGTTAEHREVLFSDRTQHTSLTRAYSGRLARGVPNRLMEEMARRTEGLAPFPVQGWFLSKLRAAVTGAQRTDLVALYSGQIGPNLRHRTTAALMAALVGETEAIG